MTDYRETTEPTTGDDPGIASDLHDTITEILSAHQANSWGCLCGWQYNVLDDYSHFDHVATVLIREAQSINYTTGKVTNHYRAATKQRRYVTDWTADE